MPTYAPAPAPMVVHAPAAASDGGGKAMIGIIAIILAIVGAAGGYMIGVGAGPSWNELRRYEALAGRDGEIRGRDNGWSVGRKQGRTEMQYLAKYERLRTQATSFNQGWRQGLNTGRQMGVAQSRYRWGGRYWGPSYGGYGYNRYGRGYRGYGYGSYYGRGRVGNAVANAQSLANATGRPVDVIVD